MASPYTPPGIAGRNTQQFAEAVDRNVARAFESIYGRTAAEIAAGVTPVNYGYQPGDVRRYGAMLDGATDDSAAVKAALSVGGEVMIPGHAAIASAELPLDVGSDTQILGMPGVSKLTVTGSSAGHLFRAINQSRIVLRGLTLIGNNTSSAFADSAAFFFVQDAAATEVCGNLTIERCTFTNFQGDFWIYVLNTSTSYAAEGFWIRDNVFVSDTGNARGPTNLAIPDACVALQGQADGTAGLVRNAWVEDNYAELTHKKMFGIAWHSTEHVHFVGNVIENCGATAITDDKGAYALMAYDNSAASGGPGGAKPDYIYFERNRIVSPRSCGVYVADGNRIYVRGNTITGQTDEQETTLPKGAVAINNAEMVIVEGNDIDDCWGGIVLVSSTSTTGRYYARQNTIRGVAADGFGITARGTVSGKSTLFEISGNDVEATESGTRGVWLRFTSTAGAQAIAVKDNRVTGVLRCIEMYSDDTTVPDVVNVEISGNGIYGSSSAFGLAYVDVNDSETRTRIANNIFGGTWASSGIMCDIRGSTGLTIVSNEFRDMASGTGYALRTGAAQGRLEGNRFSNVASARQVEVSGDEDLGYDTPTWSGGYGDFVQNLAAEPLGATGSKYIVSGWLYDGTNWQQCRVLTGG